MLSANIKKNTFYTKQTLDKEKQNCVSNNIIEQNKYNLQLRSKSTWNFVHQDTGFLSSLKI